MATEKHFESYSDKQIRDAVERGEFDDLPGAGQPLKGLGPVYDPSWWAKGFVIRERARARADDVRQLVREELPRLRVTRDRQAALERIAQINEMVAAVNEHLPDADRIPVVEL